MTRLQKQVERLKAENALLSNENAALGKQKEVLGKEKVVLVQEKEILGKEKVVLAQQKAWLEHQLAQLKRLLHGAKRERFIAPSNQLPLPFDAEKAPEKPQEKQAVAYTRTKPVKAKHPGRNALPSHLPVEEIVIEPEANTEGMAKIGELVTEELEYKPAQLFVKRYVRPKYSKGKEEGVLVANLPIRPIEKCIAGPGLLAQSVVEKYCDHLPVYRQLQRFKREGIHIAAATVNGWQEGTYQLLCPLYETLKAQVLAEGYLQADETPVKVMEKGKGKTAQGYHWAYYSPIRKAVLFDYRPSRSREGPWAMLKNFKGYLQTDGYSAYDIFKHQEGVTMLSCMAHTRRYFEQALDSDKARATHALAEIQKLYAVERNAREENLSHAQRHLLRLQEALPVLNGLGKWVAKKYKNTLPKSPMGKALGYTVARWDNLLNYLNDGALEIDNNLVENKIRPIAIGRKNYLFAGSHHGAERAALFYSLFGSCANNGINPYQWLKYALEKIPNYKVNKLHQLLPYNIDKGFFKP